MKLINICCVVAVTIQCALPAMAELSKGDKTFIMDTAQAGMTEVKLGEIAREKANSVSAKSFAENMIKDHTAANAKLKALAERKGVTVPASLNGEHQALVDKFRGIDGKSFDSAYAAQMVADHKKVVASLTSQSNKGDVDLRTFSKQTLPTIKHHLKMAENIKSGGAM